MLNTLSLLLVFALCTLAPEAEAQRKTQPSPQQIGQLASKALRANPPEELDLRAANRTIRDNDYASVGRIQRAIARDTRSLDEALQVLMERREVSRADAELFRSLAAQTKPQGARGVAARMLRSSSQVTAAVGSMVAYMVDNTEEMAPQSDSGGNFGENLGNGLDNLNWGDIAKDGALGAAIGGSFGGAIGAAIGGAIAAITSGLGDFLSGFFGGGGDGDDDSDSGSDSGSGGSGGGGNLPAPTPGPAP